MKPMLKNIKLKILCTFPVFITICMVFFIQSVDGIRTYRFIVGGFPMIRPETAMGFLVFLGYIQFINSDAILYVLKNETYLIPRYKKRSILFSLLVKEIIIVNFIFILVLTATITIYIILSVGMINSEQTSELLEISLRAYLTCLIFSSIQLILMLVIEESHVFVIMIGISIFFVIFSQINLRIFSLFPIILPNEQIILNILFCILVVIIGFLTAKKLFVLKELN